MLYLITKQLPMHVGEYRVEKIDSDAAASLIKANYGLDKLRSLIHFASTASAIASLTELRIDLVERAEPPILDSGDIAIEIRLRPNTAKGQRAGLEDLEFYLIRFRTDYEAKQQLPSMWPMVMN